MSNYTNVADFSSKGLNIGKDAKVMTYLHGLSDFWVYMFDDASKINMMMESNALVASDIYNKFLQLTSIISLDNISVLTNAQIKLLLISESDLVAGSVEKYNIPSDVPLKACKFLANRAFLPTSLLENEADYYLDPDTNTITFAKPLASMQFPFRTLSDGTKQYAMWAIDAKIDDQLIYEYYAKLINIDPTASTDLFKQFVYGMYYLFVNGPNMETMKRGLNIALGIPLARDIETVLEIRKYLNTDQWLVITDLNSYVVPYGLEPTVAANELLEVGQEIAEWIEVKDYWNDGEWWVNFMLPSHLMPHVPPLVPGGGGVVADVSPDRYMTAGSYSDWLMRNYLKKHTFLVNVKTVGFKNIQSFEQLASIIHDVKPSYTTPIYVWTVPVGDEIINLIDTLEYSFTLDSCETITDGISRFHRGNTTDPISRCCCPTLIRMSAPASLDDLTGYNPELNGHQRTFQGGTVTGFIAPQESYRDLTGKENAWNTCLRTRGQDQYVAKRGLLDFKRNITGSGDGVGVHPYASLYPGYRLVALHTTTLADVKDKFEAVNATLPDGYIFDLFKPSYIIDAIDENAIDDSLENNSYDFILANFNYLFTKGWKGTNLGPLFPAVSRRTFVPDPSQLTRSDFLVFTRINSTVCGVYWATKNFTYETEPYVRHEEPDVLTMRVSGKITRGMAPMGSPYYQLRSANFTIGYGQTNEIDAKPINEAEDPSTVIYRNYDDDFNSSFPMDRSGRTLVTQRTFK